MSKPSQNSVRAAWLLLLVYMPMMLIVTLHTHCDSDLPTTAVYCQDCAHHIHHSGHFLAYQHNSHFCALCQLHNTLYLPPAVAILATALTLTRIIHSKTCSKCLLLADDATSSRAPPYLWVQNTHSFSIE